MKKQRPLTKYDGAQRMIFSGMPIGLLTLFMLSVLKWHYISDKYYPVYFFIITLVVFVFTVMTCDMIPKRLALILGIVGWIAAFSILCWSMWYGPLALGHASLN